MVSPSVNHHKGGFMPKHGKKYMAAAEKVDRNQNYPPAEALTLAKDTSTASFDATVEAHIRLGVDPRHADQQVRDVVVLPHGLGKSVRVLVFAQGEGATSGAPGWRGCGCG
jgi:large subunit ribosomal protein L1